MHPTPQHDHFVKQWMVGLTKGWLEFTYSRNIVPIVCVMAFMEYCVVKIADRQRNVNQMDPMVMCQVLDGFLVLTTP